MGVKSSRVVPHSNSALESTMSLPTIRAKKSYSTKALKTVSFRTTTPSCNETLSDALQRKRFRELKEAEIQRELNEKKLLEELIAENNRKNILERKQNVFRIRSIERLEKLATLDRLKKANEETMKSYNGIEPPQNDIERLNALWSYSINGKRSTL